MERNACAGAKGEASKKGLGRKRRIASLLVTSTILGSAGLFVPATAHAQQQSAGQSVNFNIPAQSLRSAINAFTRATGWEVGFTSAAVNGKRSTAVSGSMAPAQALRTILAGTGVNAQVSGPSTAALVANSAGGAGNVAADGSLVLETITVQGANPNSTIQLTEPYAGGQVARGGQVGMLGNRNVMNTPFSQTSYTNKTAQDQQARTVHDVLANDPSVITNRTASRHDWETIRGLSNSGQNGGRSLNGLQGVAPIEFPSAEYLERVEVLKGPSALLIGMGGAGHGNIGGSVNLVTKQAGDEPLTEVTTRYESRSQLGTHVDIGRRFGLNKEFGIRFNGTFDKGDTNVDTQHAKNGVAALNLDYRGERVRLSLDFAHESRDVSPISNIVSIRSIVDTLSKVPNAPDNSKSLFPSWSMRESTSTLGMIRGEVDLLDNVTAYAAVGLQKFEYNQNLISPAWITGADGTFQQYTTWERLKFQSLAANAGIRATATTGQIDHALNLQVSGSRFSHFQSLSYGPTLDRGTIYNPVYSPMPSLTDPGDPLKVVETDTFSIGIADTMSFLDERIQFTAGLRYQKIDVDTFDYDWGSAGTSTYKSDAWSPAFGLVVKPWENVSLYANYIQGLQPGMTVSSYFANAGDVFPPYVSKQYEAGVKVDWGRVTTTLAAFQISQPNVLYTLDSGSGLYTAALNGEQRNRGIELSAYGEVSDGVRLLGGVTFLEAVQTKTTDGAFDGERAQGAPRVRAVIGGEWDTPFVEGLTLSGRLTYTSNQVVDNSTPDLKIPSWTTVDLGARYSFNSPWNDQPITVRFNVDNVLNKSYWVTADTGFLPLSQPRTFRLSTTFKF